MARSSALGLKTISTSLLALSLGGCGTLLGLGDYEIVDDDGTNVGDGDGDSTGDGDGSTGGSSGDGDGDTGSGGAGTGSGGSSSAGGSPSTDCPNECDDGNDCTTDACVDSECVHTTVDAGEACSGGVCNGISGDSSCVRCVDDRPGDNQDAGCPEGAPRCRTTGTPICTGCDSHADCNDSNECTEDTCNPDGECVITTVAAGEDCSGGVCNGVAENEACNTCFNTSPDGTDLGCTADDPICDGGVCGDCEDDQGGTEVDSGCSMATPMCDDGVCQECITAADCNDDVACTDDICTAGICENNVNHGNCSDSGDVCNPNRCDAVADCGQVDVSTTVALIDSTQSNGDGSFEWGPVSAVHPDWTQVGPNYWSIAECIPTDTCLGATGDVAAQGADQRVAWLGIEHDELTGINQLVAVPANTVSLSITADTNFQTDEVTLGAGQTVRDTMVLNLINPDTGMEAYPVRSWTSADAQTGSDNEWTMNGISETVDISGYTGAGIRVAFEMNTNGSRWSDFFMDRIEVTAKVCAP